MSPLPFFQSLTLDIEAHTPPGDRGGSPAKRLRRALAIIVGSSGFHVALLYRAGHALRPRLGLLGRASAFFASWLIRHGYGCSIAPSARIEGGLILPHPQGIVIGPGVKVGPRAWIFQNVTIGGSPGREGMPCVGPDARIFPGAVLAGPITIGANVVVGANTVVTTDVPGRQLVRGPAAEVVPLPAPFQVNH